MERRLDAGAVPVTRGGKTCCARGTTSPPPGSPGSGWRDEWEAARLFLTADGEAAKAWGNETIRVAPRRGLAGAEAARPARAPGEPAARPVPAVAPGRVRPPGRRGRRAGIERGGPLRHRLRPGDAAAGTSTPAGRSPRARSRRWSELRPAPVVAVDVNVGHLAAAVIAADGNVTGTPFTVPLELAGLPAHHPGRTAARRRHPPHRHREGSRGAGNRDRGPRL